MISRSIQFATFLFAALPLFASGFEIDIQGARAAGLAGACAAQAADPTAVFCNPGALALIPKRKGMAAGMSVSAFEHSFYEGLPPGAGAGTAAQQTTPRAMLPHVFAAVPLGANAVFGTGFYHPFRLQTEWTSPEAFAGRFVATSARIDAYDLAPTLAVHAGDVLGLGAGLVVRTSTAQAARHVLATAGDGTTHEIGALTMTSDAKRALGWTAGLFVRPGRVLSFGASFRSKTKTSVNGTGVFTQIASGNAQLDQLVASTFSPGQPILLTTSAELPSRSVIGVALTPGEALLLEIDTERTGWRGVHDISFVFPSTPALNTAYALSFDDSWTYRGGVRWRFATGPQLRLGTALVKTPLPDRAVGPFFPDADRSTVTLGIGLDWLDLAAGMTTYKQRIVTTSSAGLNGNYRAKSWFAVMTMTK